MKKKCSSFFSNRREIPEPEPETEKNMEGIYSLLKEFKTRQEETDLVLRNMDANVLQKLSDNRDAKR